MQWSMDRVQRGGPWTGSTGVVHGPGVPVLYTSCRDISCNCLHMRIRRIVLLKSFLFLHCIFQLENQFSVKAGSALGEVSIPFQSAFKQVWQQAASLLSSWRNHLNRSNHAVWNNLCVGFLPVHGFTHDKSVPFFFSTPQARSQQQTEILIHLLKKLSSVNDISGVLYLVDPTWIFSPRIWKELQF